MQKPNGDTLLIEQENVKAFTPINDAGRSTYSVYQGFTTSKEEGTLRTRTIAKMGR